ncbi:hypothetical protein [Zavarzinella formosa]|uniref:hypothetical protein n=1 Tax=Zavarzinella formosa TaxID=360055 RepID=UPI0004973A84|nr:hypothetical protein [Zavarzinella formosa]
MLTESNHQSRNLSHFPIDAFNSAMEINARLVPHRPAMRLEAQNHRQTKLIPNGKISPPHTIEIFFVHFLHATSSMPACLECNGWFQPLRPINAGLK